MTENEGPPSLGDLGQRLRRARQREAEATSSGSSGGRPRFTGIALAFRVGVELVAALAVGVGAGLLIDHWLGTTPWGLVVFFVLGWAAGVLNVYRAVTGMGSAVGYRNSNGGNDTV
jgi:ATP synthase protein I